MKTALYVAGGLAGVVVIGWLWRKKPRTATETVRASWAVKKFGTKVGPAL